MRPSRWLVTLAVCSTTTVALVAACGFPSISFAPTEDGSSGSTSGGSSGTSGGNGESGAVGDDDDLAAPDSSLDAADAEAEAEAEAPKGDAAPEDAAHDAVPPGQDAAGCCDCDGDGYFNQNGACAGRTPVDCDDSNTLVNAGRTFNADPAESKWKGDWNCDTVVEKFYDEKVNCGSHLLSSLLGGQTCDQFKGFDSTVVCGSQGNYIVCKNGGLTCATDATRTQLLKQQCR